ncbi:MAG TPA: TIGR03435 family protein [Terracidiphilus sp.]|jgi:uncharacterized protein (TIGR03435 family)
MAQISQPVGLDQDFRKSASRITTNAFDHRALIRAAAVLVGLLTIGFGGVLAQSPAENARTPEPHRPGAPQFDVVSIKPSAPNQDGTLFQYFPDRTSFRGAAVRMVLQTVFGVDDDHIIGAPSWVNTNRYDIEAKVSPEDAPRLDKLNGDERRAMLIPLLTERFHLKYHHEMREQSMYALTIAKGGPRLTRGEPDPPPGWKPSKDTPPQQEHYKIVTVPGHIDADSIPMGVLADQLSRLHALGRSVVDKTGLTGNYNFSLKWTADNDPFPGLRRMLREADGLDSRPTDDAGLPLFTALREQLGLNLEPLKGQGDVIVIDHIDPPSPN